MKRKLNPVEIKDISLDFINLTVIYNFEIENSKIDILSLDKFMSQSKFNDSFNLGSHYSSNDPEKIERPLSTYCSNSNEIIIIYLLNSETQDLKCDGSLVLHSVDLQGKIDGVLKEFELQTDKIFVIRGHKLLNYSIIFGSNNKFFRQILIMNNLETIKKEANSICFQEFSSRDLLALRSFSISAFNFENYQDQFLESSTITIENFLSEDAFLQLKNYVKNTVCWKNVGPADYLNFDILSLVDTSIEPFNFFSNSFFLNFLTKLTKLPIYEVASKPFLRRLNRFGQYQIFHGNYVEIEGVDLIYSFYTDLSEWDESNCGRIHYLDDNGEEIFEVPIKNNSLTIVYRSSNSTRFTDNVKGIPPNALYQYMKTFSLHEILDE
jgi:hypothetical protein